MKITILSYGSRGDVQPFVALALGLQKNGHEVKLAAPRDWLLPRCKAVVHHGGAGTTAAGLRAGIPNIVIPFAGDQAFWGKRVHAIGAGPRPIPVGGLNAERLALAIAEAGDDVVRRRAQAIGRGIGSEGGVMPAVEVIESHVRDWKSRPEF